MSERTQIEGLDVPNVTEWFEKHAGAVDPPLEFDLIAGGRSNLTFKVSDTAHRTWVLRRPPLGHVLATAHDMSREHTIIAALGPTDVPVPPTVGLCTDDAVNGAPFYVMDHIDGIVVRDASAAEALSPAQRRTAGLSVAETLAKIHAVDPDAVGLGELGRKEGYIARQLKRWYGQWESSKTRELPAVDEAHARLAAAIPDQGPAAIVHGDYRLDNCIVSPDGEVVAVLDWELCTLGDPMADLGLLMVYWPEPGDTLSAIPGTATALEGFPARAELVSQYEKASGRTVTDLAYYEAFGYWKLACILEGVYARYRGGAMGSDASGFEFFSEQVRLLADAALEAIDRVGG
ncbi:MAG: phosphotransferase family protein [Acidimicrobiales bacterium]|nr:phosphotransferase family protein [Acidimicrobiales bacterium]